MLTTEMNVIGGQPFFRLPDAPELKTTKEALDHSIEKWKTIVEKMKEGHELFNVHAPSCALCAKFFKNSDDELTENCSGCPVYKKTGNKYCETTPYEKFSGHRIEHNLKLMYAIQELEFLKGLKDEYKEEPELCVQERFANELIKFDTEKCLDITVNPDDSVCIKSRVIYSTELSKIIELIEKYSAIAFITTDTNNKITLIVHRFRNINP